MLFRPIVAALLLLVSQQCLSDPGENSGSDARQDEVRKKGAQVMPFALEQTMHVFDRTDFGGVQRVRTRADAPDQVVMIRRHLQGIAKSFTERDFSAPEHLHGADMPGLAEMKAARPGDLSVTYRELPDGAEIEYRSRSPQIISAIHLWFDAQLRDHGHDATTSAATTKLEVFSWLTGNWVIDDGDKHTDEIWTAPATDMMLGMSRSVRNGKTTEFEFVRIVERTDGVFYIAQPGGRPPVEFRLQSWDGKEAVFINPGTSDHLRRIIYRRNPDGSMTARIEGANDGKDFSEDYPYRRLRSHHVD